MDMTARFALAVEELDRVFGALEQWGYEVVGPTVRADVIVYDRLASAADLPAGWADQHEPGGYRLRPRDDDARFGYVVGPHSWKRYLHPARLAVWSGVRTDAGWDEVPAPPPKRLAFVGVRPCELAGIGVLDAVFTGGPIVDDGYAHRRAAAFLIAVECTEPGATCFCASVGTGPGVDDSTSHGAMYDLVLTELLVPDHVFVVRAGSDRGRELIEELDLPEATPAEVHRAAEEVEAAALHMGRRLDTDGLPELLAANLEHPLWQEIARRCLTCANCTMVCPTCFCSTTEDTSDLAGVVSRRWRTWDSCFTLDFSYVGGAPARSSTRSRYRQWLLHKLVTWHDQFGTSGCVGCGRCITWCPVGIDLTVEIAAIAREPGGST